MTQGRTMMRLKFSLLCGAAATSLVPLSAAFAQTISSEQTTPVVTSSTGDVTIDSNGSVVLTSGTAVTIDSDNTVTNEGEISVGTVDDAIGVLVTGDRTFGYTQSGDIDLSDDTTTEDETPPDFADDRFGFRLAAGSYTGDVEFTSDSSVLLNGDTSSAIAFEGNLTGDVSIDGAVSISGANSVAIDLQGDLVGDLSLSEDARIVAAGVDSDGIRISGDVTGAVYYGGTMTVSGFQDLTPDADDDEDNNNDAQAALSSGNGITISGDITEGFLIDGALPSRFATTAELTARDDANLVYDAPDGGNVNVLGNGFGLLIDGGVDGITLGLVDTSNVEIDPLVVSDATGISYGDFGFINRGDVTANGTYEGVSANAARLANVTIDGGVRNDGQFSAIAFGAAASAIEIGANTNTPTFVNAGNIVAASADVLVEGEPDTILSGGATALSVETGAQILSLVNAGTIVAQGVTDTGDVVAVRDSSGTITAFRNEGVDLTGNSAAVSATLNDFSDNNDDTTIDDASPTGRAIAMDFSANTVGIDITNTVPVNFTLDPTFRPLFGSVAGDVLTGSGNDSYIADAGFTQGNLELGAGDDRVELSDLATITGDIDFGIGNDTLSLDNGGINGDLTFAGTGSITLVGNSVFNGSVTSASPLTVDVQGSRFFLGAGAALDVTTLNVAPQTISDEVANGVLGFTVSRNETTDLLEASSINATTSVSLADGTEIRTVFLEAFEDTDLTQTIISSPLLTANIDQLVLNAEGQTPALFEQSITRGGTADQDLVLTLRRRTASEMGIGEDLQPAYDAVINAVTADDALGAALFNINTSEEFVAAHNQMLGGPLDAPLAYALLQNNTVSSIVTQRLDNVRLDEALTRTAWLQQQGYFLNRGSDENSNGFDGGGFVMAAGVDMPLGPIDAVGVSGHFASARYDEQEGEDFPFNRTTFGIDLYAAENFGQIEVDGRVGYAVSDSKSERTIAFGGERRSLTGEWEGTQMTANGRVRYRGKVSNYDVIPFASVDYVSVDEDGYTETGDDTLALTVSDRDAQSLRGNLGVSVGKTIELRPSAYDTGIPGTLRPRVTAAFGHELGSDDIEAQYNFVDGTPFVLTAEPEQWQGTLGFDLDYQNQYAKVNAGIAGSMGEVSENVTFRVSVGLKW